MVVLPAAKMVNLSSLRQATGCEQVGLTTEQKFKELFPDCEVGAMPPFGNLYDMDVFAADALPRTGKISFNAGTHHEIIRMNAEDWDRAVHPVRLKLALDAVLMG
jgi:Ala-tRNA(Pro) deacylase